ncbi:energy transducer TonB [Hydrocarboniphaga sp.]|uniref:energy transducer TonB n=1 Tax=Hydrocarboniphaga sp. TaxID=2033016 RepID=UPI003D121C58
MAAIISGVQAQLRYPEDSRKAGNEGRALVTVSVDRDGKIRKAELKQSSGFAALDAEAVAVFYRIDHLPPLPANGQPGSSLVTLLAPVDFKMTPLPEGARLAVDGQPLDDAAGGVVSDPALSASQWLIARSRRYAALAASARCDVLVVPVQVEMAAFDRPSRQIMSAELAAALAGGGTCVFDPYLADLALGEGLRRRPAQAVLDLAAALQAGTVVTTYAGHDDHGHMRITMQIGSAGAAQAARANSINNCQFDDDHPPFLCFRQQLPVLLKSLGLKATPRSASRLGEMPRALPLSPAVFQQPESRDVLSDASRLMLLAMLAPAAESRSGERLFTKAWMRLEEAPSVTPAVLRMRARIMLHLQQRPYALSLIAADGSDEAKALRALLNGHLPDARSSLGRAKGDWERLFLALEVNDLEQRYGRSDKTADKAAGALLGGMPWAPLLKARLGDKDSWLVTDTLPLKQLLDQFYPIAGFDVSSEVLGKSVIGGQTALDFQQLALRHVHRLLEQQGKKFCCSSYSTATSSLDFLDLLDGRIERSLIGQASFQTSPQGRPDTGLAILDAYDSELGGNPDFEAARTAAYSNLLEKGQLKDRQTLIARRNTAARLAVGWEQAQSRASNLPLYDLRNAKTVGDDDPLGAYGLDFPIRSYWTDRFDVEQRRLAFSTDNVRPLSDLVDAGRDVAKWLAELDTRFVGDEAATKLRLKNWTEAQRSPDALRAEVARDPDNWELRDALANALIHKGAYQDIAAAVLGFPGFQDSRAAEKAGNTVGLANHAFKWGDELFWLGEVEAARPLLKSAAAFDNGAASSIGARTKLALLDKDYGAAAISTLTSARRYNEPRRYDDFLRLLFASGRTDQAWAMVDQVFSKLRADAVWGAVMVGNRLSGQNPAQLADWLGTHASENRLRGTRDALLRYAFSEAYTDRAVDPGFPAYLKTFAGTSDAVVDERGKVSASASNGQASSRLGPGAFGADRHPKLAAGSVVPERFVLLAEAMTSLRSGRYAEAVQAFDRLSSFYDLQSDELQFVWPYFAYAAAMSGDTLKLEAYLAKLAADDAASGVWLARAVFAGLADRADESQAAMSEAYLKWDKHYRAVGLPASYVFADIGDMLYEKKSDPRYRDQVLRVARAIRTVQPTDAYAYAAIAKLGNDESERVEALAIALYLDPRSLWASQTTSELRAKATRWRQTHQPFEFKISVPGI